MTIMRHGRRFWRLEEEDGTLVCVTVYRKGAEEVVRRLVALGGPTVTENEERTGKTTEKKGAS